MKIDSDKAYDKVNWDFLRLVLLLIGLHVEVTNWIMACVSSASFVALINGSPAKIFRSSTSLRLGCPLSPLLFILMIEGLRIMVSKACKDGHFTTIRFSSIVEVTHLLFVYDVIFFGLANIKEWKHLHSSLDIFCNRNGH